jgi:hypothetical protein
MTLRLEQPPQRGANLVKQALAEWARIPRPEPAEGGKIAPAVGEGGSEGAVAPPYRVYVLGLDDLAEGHGLEASQPVGWKYLVLRGDTVVQPVDLAGGTSGEDLQLSHVTQGPFVREAQGALDRVEQLGGDKERSYELRYLSIPGLCLAALWLKDDRGEADKIIPVPPVPATLEPERVYSPAEFAEQLHEPARTALAFDRELQSAHEAEAQAATGVRPPAMFTAEDLASVVAPYTRLLRRVFLERLAAVAAVCIGLSTALGTYLAWPGGTGIPVRLVATNLALEAQGKLGGPVEEIKLGTDGVYHVKAREHFAVRIESPRKGYGTFALFGPKIDHHVFPLPGEDAFPVEPDRPEPYRNLPGPEAVTLLLVVVTETPFADTLREALGDDLSRFPEMASLEAKLQGALKASGQKWWVVRTATLVPD